MSGAEGEKKRRSSARLLRDLNILGLLVLMATASALLLSPRRDEALLGLPELSAGDEAPRTIKAPRDFAIEDPETTDRLRKDAVARVRPVYDHYAGYGSLAKTRIERAFSAAGEEAEPPDAQSFMRALGVYFDSADFERLKKAGFSPPLRDATIMAVRAIFERQIVSDKELLKVQAPEGLQLRVIKPNGVVDHEESVFDYTDIASVDEAKAEVDQIVAKKLAHLEPFERQAVALISKRLLKANVASNDLESQRRAIGAREAVKKVVIPIKRGETVIRSGERVSERHLMILEGMSKKSSGQNRLQAPLGSAALFVLLIIAGYQFSRRTKLVYLSTHRDLAFVATVSIVMLFTMWGGYKVATWLRELSLGGVQPELYRYLLPVAAAPLLLRFVMGARVAVAFIPVAAITAAWTMDRSLGYAAYVLIGAFVAAAVPVGDRPRSGLFSAGVWCGLAQGLMTLVLALLAPSFVMTEVILEVFAAVVSGVLSALIVILVLPLVEVLFGYTTRAKLASLANLNHPLLRELLVQAPGTYHHSIVVGQLAESAARRIGADPLLARVGGYYHDVGKLKNPELFEENRRSEELSELGPNEEAAEIRMHVAEGLELGAKHRLGQPILEIIAQHHGTGGVGVGAANADDMWSRERNSILPLPFDELTPAPGGRRPPPELSYAGPKPIGAEAGLVLMADAVESATAREVAQRPLEEGALEATVDRVIREVLAAGQLDACEISLQKVHMARDEFVTILREILTRRGRPTGSSMSRGMDPRLVIPPAPVNDQPN